MRSSAPLPRQGGGRGRRGGRSGCRSPPRDILFLPELALGNLDIILRALRSGSLSWCCLVQQWIQSLCQFSEALVFFLIFYVLDSDPEVVPESGHSSTHPWYLAATGSVFTLQLVLKNARMRLVKGFFALSPNFKKVRRLLRTRGRNCLRTPAHGRWRLSWRTPSSGCGSGMTTLASRTTGTDALGRLPGSHRLASGLCGAAKGMRRERCTTGTRSSVSVRVISLLFLLSEELHRQPRAVYKYWAPCRLCWEDTYAVGWFLSTAPRIWQSPVRCSPWFDSGYMLRQSTAAFVGDC